MIEQVTPRGRPLTPEEIEWRDRLIALSEQALEVLGDLVCQRGGGEHVATYNYFSSQLEQLRDTE